MRRRGKASGNKVKTQRRQALKHRNAPKVAARRKPSVTDPYEKIALLGHRLDEALEQQAAMSEILGVISNSPTDLAPVFNTILANATRLCEGNLAALWRYDGNFLIGAAQYNASTAFVDKYMRIKMEPGRSGPARLAALERRTVHVADIAAEPGFSPLVLQYERARSVLAVPLLRQKDLVGVIAIWRREVRPFTDKQIELLTNFATQAVIAIENTRLLNELRESLQQQTATADVLKVISSSPGELKSVFESILANATRICEAKFGALFLSEGDEFRTVALHGVTAEYAEARRRESTIRPGPGTSLNRAASTRQPVQIADIRAEPAYTNDPKRFAILDLAGARTIIAVPMLKEDKLVGIINIYRTEVRPFTEKQIDLVKNFAAQAVIAIENTRLLNELRQRTDDLSESLEQQTATSEVLKVISSSPGDLQPVFDAILANATDLCGARFASLRLSEGDQFRTVSLYNAPAALAEHWRSTPLVRPHPESALGRTALTKQVVQIDDVKKGAAYNKRDPLVMAGVDLGGYRTVLAVPMLKEDVLIGIISIYRQEVKAFTGKQIELAKNFASQAVIAIENTRLLSELRESLQQQTATSDVLRVISSSPGELQPVFGSILANATRICEAKFGTLYLREADGLRTVATHNAPTSYVEDRKRNLVRPPPDSALGQVLKTHRVTQVADITAVKSYVEGDPYLVSAVKLGGYRTIAAVPMLKDDLLIGAITINRQEVRPFTDKQIELVKNFAAQAVIAIENTRLLNELRKSLQQQTATADVLRIISSSPGQLAPVFDAMLENATRICGAGFGTMFQFDGKLFDFAANYGTPPALVEFQKRRGPFLPEPGGVLDRVLRTKQVAHCVDWAAEQPQTPPVALGGARSTLAVPMLKDNELVGGIVIYRKEVRPFSDKEIDLVKNFAAQAVIAIENTRLLSELRESLQQQTATADVLKVISRSTFDLQMVLDTLVELAARLCEARNANIWQPKGAVYRLAASYNENLKTKEFLEGIAIEAGRGTVVGRSLLERKTVHVHDVQADPDYLLAKGRGLDSFRTVLAVPMLREGVATGVLALTRREVRPFTDKQIELVQTFADQAAIAIENVRLFESVESRTRELAASLENLRTTQDRLVQTQKLASLGQLTAGIAHEIKNPLNFVNNFSAVSAELIDELREALAGANLDKKLRTEISEIADTLRGNLDKVVQHGKRADAIVKNMLLHSREGSGEHRPVDINALVEEGLNLAYHGARAEKQGFNVTLERSFDPAADQADVFPQDITRVLLNLILNGFYAATKRKAEANSDGYEPILAVSTRSLGDRVEITVRDNGTGISPEVKEKMFNPFFTTKPAGEGTGLGLSISHDIIVKQHGGTIEVETQPGEYTEFRIVLPRAAVFVTASGASP